LSRIAALNSSSEWLSGSLISLRRIDIDELTDEPRAADYTR
jgi:hypothetical protein